MPGPGRIEDHLPLVRRVAGSVARTMPPHVDQNDLEQYGFLGLHSAFHRFDSSHGVKFETYAAKRIRGAMLDGMREEDWVPRQVRSRKEPVVSVGSLSHIVAGPLGPAPLWKLVADPGEDASSAVDARDWVNTRIVRLRPKVRTAVERHFLKESTMREVGDSMGITDSRVSQMCHDAMLIMAGDVREKKTKAVVRFVVEVGSGKFYAQQKDVARDVGCSQSAVSRVIRTGGPLRGRWFRYATDSEMRAYNERRAA